LLGLLVAAVFVVPGQAAVTIVGERERQTLPLLQVSQLSASRIIVGKLVSALLFILLLLVVVAPLLVIPVLLGGVTVRDVVAGIGMVGAACVTIGALSMWISARARSMQGAVLGSYVVAVLFTFGSLALVLAEVLLLAPTDLGPTRYAQGIPRDSGREIYSAWVSPVVGLVDASDDVLQFGGEVVTSPYLPFRQVLVKRQGFAASSVDTLYDPFGGVNVATTFEEPFGRGFSTTSVGTTITTRHVDPIRGAVWWRTLGFEALLTMLAVWRAARLVHVPRARVFRRDPEEVAGAA
jgi:ABC-type transport system involved in multi-copper enzyme maturation permease subunit